MITLEALRGSPTIVENLAWPFDFDLMSDDDFSGIRLKPSQPFTMIAGEGAGGVFLTHGTGELENCPILFASSEGQAGRVAKNLTEWLAILIALPYWRDLLKFSGGGQLAEMRKTAVFTERESAEEMPELPEARLRILNALPIPNLTDPIRALYENVKATDCTLIAEEQEFESLFNTFTSADNPMWR